MAEGVHSGANPEGSDTFDHGEAEECMTLRSKPKTNRNIMLELPLCMKHANVRPQHSYLVLSKKVQHQLADFMSMALDQEMAPVQQDKLQFLYVSLERLSTWCWEDKVVLAPDS